MMMRVGLGQNGYDVMECSEMGMVEDPMTGACVLATVPSEYPELILPELTPVSLPPGGQITGATVSYPSWDVYKLATGALVKILSTATPPAGATLVSRGVAPTPAAQVISGVPNTYLLIGGAALIVLLAVVMGRR